MKILIGYDGSEYSDTALDELKRAGLPRDSEVLVASVADLLKNTPPVSEFDVTYLASRRVDGVLSRAKGFRARVIKEAKELGSEAAERLRPQFPEWKIDFEALRGSPANELLRKAAEWKADLIVVGSQGRGAIGRFFLGSVSKRIAEEAECSVRVARGGSEKDADARTEIVAGASSLPDVERLVRAIGRRVWSDETEVRLIAVDDGISPGRVSAVYPDARAIFNQSAESLVAVGLKVSVDIRSGNLKSVLLEDTENCRADSIFVVAGGASDGSSLGEAATNLITGAKCTVEIVR